MGLIEFIIVQSSRITRVFVIPWEFNLFGKGISSGCLYVTTSISLILNLSFKVIISTAQSIFLINYYMSILQI